MDAAFLIDIFGDFDCLDVSGRVSKFQTPVICFVYTTDSLVTSGPDVGYTAELSGATLPTWTLDDGGGIGS